MCRPRLRIDKEEESSIVPVSLDASDFVSFMSRDKGSQRLTGSQLSPHDEENNYLLRDELLGFDRQLPLEKIFPTSVSSDMDFPRPIPIREEPGDLEPITRLTAKTGKKGKIVRPIIIVQHNYHDHAHEKESDHPLLQPKSRGGVSIPFPLKLHDMLDSAMAEGYGDIVSWQPHGRCFVVYKAKEFQDIVLPKYFKLNKISSFQRQLNLYGFQRLTFGRDRGGYYHERFLRHKKFLAHGIKRVQVKGTGVRARSNPDQEPNFWTMKWCDPTVVSTDSTEKSNSIEREPSTKINASDNGMASTWNASTSHQGEPSLQQEEYNGIWTMADLEPIHIRDMEWGNSNVANSNNNYPQGNRQTDNSDGKRAGMISTWNAPTSLDETQSYQKMLTFPKNFQPLRTKKHDMQPRALRDVLPDQNMNGWQHSSYCGSKGVQAENGNLLDSFGERAFPLIIPIQEQSMNSMKNGGFGKSLYSDSFGFQI